MIEGLLTVKPVLPMHIQTFFTHFRAASALTILTHISLTFTWEELSPAPVLFMDRMSLLTGFSL